MSLFHVYPHLCLSATTGEALGTSPDAPSVRVLVQLTSN